MKKCLVGIAAVLLVLLAACGTPPADPFASPTGAPPVVVRETAVVRETVVVTVRETAVPAPAQPTVAPQPTEKPAPTEKPQPTAVPTVAQPTGVATSAQTVPETQTQGALGLKYQYDGGCDATKTPMEFPACVLQRVQNGELTGEQAVVMIQALGKKYEAPSFEDTKFALPNLQPALFWCPGGVKLPYPPDTARPLSGTKGAKWADTLFVIDRGTGGPERIVESKTTDKCWIVYRR